MREIVCVKLAPFMLCLAFVLSGCTLGVSSDMGTPPGNGPSEPFTSIVCPAQSSGDKPAVPLRIEIRASQPLRIDTEASLIFRIEPLSEAPNSELNIRLPEEITLLAGDLSWKGDLAAHQIYEHTLTVRFGSFSQPVTVQSDVISTAADGAQFGLPCSVSFRNVGKDVQVISNP